MIHESTWKVCDNVYVYGCFKDPLSYFQTEKYELLSCLTITGTFFKVYGPSKRTLGGVLYVLIYLRSKLGLKTQFCYLKL